MLQCWYCLCSFDAMTPCCDLVWPLVRRIAAGRGRVRPADREAVRGARSPPPPLRRGRARLHRIGVRLRHPGQRPRRARGKRKHLEATHCEKCYVKSTKICCINITKAYDSTNILWNHTLINVTATKFDITFFTVNISVQKIVCVQHFCAKHMSLSICRRKMRAGKTFVVKHFCA